ncbi:TonB-dependent receptor [Leptolyngbya sp. 7M]|uniref:TonB-dependent receptor n=1 Tax=Leptolyngbya sp. 7M TaxID=2812896 RepID=UPI001B8B09DF|nr:TonB-dependent receptor [Leptolyngbya sp. 7M]QYO67920.1 TonB-dependent receptor [Leptolyngbya sp. 7M]
MKQVRSATDGSFVAKILPGKYTILAVAEGYNPVRLAEVELDRASLANYGFRLERAGGGNTLPEKRSDRNNPKWNVRAGALARSIYQNVEGDLDRSVGEPGVEDVIEPAEPRSGQRKDSVMSVAETFVVSTPEGPYAGLNYATKFAVNNNINVVLAAQTGIGRNAPLRLEGQFDLRPGPDHRIRLRAAYGKIGRFIQGNNSETLGQLSFQATDEWRVREGIVLVYGLDYSRLIGAGDSFSLNPRIGFQYDLGPKTRLRSAFTSTTENRSWSHAIELEDAQVFFREPASIADVAVENGEPVLNRSNRLEFGVERVIDNRSSVELNAFFDTTFARGVAFSAIGSAGQNSAVKDFTGNQQGESQGIRVVYSRRLNGLFSTGAGYSFGNGQRVSDQAISSPESLFESDLFHTVFGRFDVDLVSGTSIRTVFRFSPQATVFAIDPFQGRLAIYDPGLSVLVTQSLPTLGLPLRAEAILDARNLLDSTIGVTNEEGGLRLSHFRRSVKGSILVRF